MNGDLQAWQLVEWGQPLQRVVRTRPQPEGTQVLLRVQACGVCHSDVHQRSGSYDFGEGRQARLADLGFRLPLTLGHEIAGEVVALGPEATIALGTRCVVFPWIGCGACRHCRRDREIDCDNPASLGIRRDGGYASHVLVPHERYLFSHAGIDAGVAATAACSGITAYSALRKLPACSADDTLVIIGAGGLGMTALGLAQRLSPARTVVVDKDPRKLDAARAHADAVLNIAEPDAAAALRRFAGDGAAGVLDFVGTPETFEWAMATVRRGAAIVVVGLFGGAVSLPLPRLPMRHLAVLGSYVGTRQEFAELLELLRGGLQLPTPLIARPMHEINALLDDVERGAVPGRFVVSPTDQEI